MTHHPSHLPFPRRGFSLPELLISLAICTILLVAVAAAYVSASNAIRNNDDFNRATQAARICLNQLESETRTGTIIVPATLDSNGNTTSLELLTPPTDTAASQDRLYQYNASQKQLTLTTAGSSYVLVRNVTAARFNILKSTDSTGAPCVSQVGITLTVTVGQNSVTLSGSAAPRRNLAN